MELELALSVTSVLHPGSLASRVHLGPSALGEATPSPSPVPSELTTCTSASETARCVLPGICVQALECSFPPLVPADSHATRKARNSHSTCVRQALSVWEASSQAPRSNNEAAKLFSTSRTPERTVQVASSTSTTRNTRPWTCLSTGSLTLSGFAAGAVSTSTSTSSRSASRSTRNEPSSSTLSPSTPQASGTA